MEIANNGDKSYNLEGGETKTERFCLVYFVFFFNSVHQMEPFSKPSVFISCIHSVKAPEKEFWKGRKNLEDG